MFELINSPRFFYRYIIPLCLIILSVWDLRIEIRLLIENFTYTALIFMVSNHQWVPPMGYRALAF